MNFESIPSSELESRIMPGLNKYLRDTFELLHQRDDIYISGGTLYQRKQVYIEPGSAFWIWNIAGFEHDGNHQVLLGVIVKTNSTDILYRPAGILMCDTAGLDWDSAETIPLGYDNWCGKEAV